MEERFGHDFSKVRVHHDPAAAAAAGAHAYTVGEQIVAGAAGLDRRLLAHELAHVVQQGGAVEPAQVTLHDDAAAEREADLAAVSAQPQVTHSAPASMQRQAVTGTRSSIPVFEIGGTLNAPRQVMTRRVQMGADLQLSYDPASGVFRVVFPLVWLFVHQWTNAQRNAYVADFVASVERVWNDRFILNEQRTSRTARVHIAFDNAVIPQMASAAHEQAQLLNYRNRWSMDVRQLTAIRENVVRHMAQVHLGEESNRPHRQTTEQLRQSGTPFAIRSGGRNRTYTQTTSPHEFGHMIGLGDEYVEDAGTPVPQALRGLINDRIMNAGENVTPDAYQPFVVWLSDLTGTQWRVGARVR